MCDPKVVTNHRLRTTAVKARWGGSLVGGGALRDGGMVPGWLRERNKCSGQQGRVGPSRLQVPRPCRNQKLALSGQHRPSAFRQKPFVQEIASRRPPHITSIQTNPRCYQEPGKLFPGTNFKNSCMISENLNVQY